KNEQGLWNFSSVGAAPAGGPTPTPASRSNSNTPRGGIPSRRADGNVGPAEKKRQISLGELQISDGQVAVTDLQQRKPRTVYDHINVALTNFTSATPFTIDGSVHFPGKGTQEIRLRGTGGPLVRNNT